PFENTHMKHYLFVLVLIVASILPAHAASSKVKVTGKLPNASGYSVLLLLRDGSSKIASPSSSGAFAFGGLNSKSLKGATLHLVKDGQYWGPIVLAQQTSQLRAATTLTGKLSPLIKRAVKLGTVHLQDTDYALLSKPLYKTGRGKFSVETNSSGAPLGAGQQGVTLRASNQDFGVLNAVQPGEDSDADGIPNALDADDDGDLILDGSDQDAAGQDVPYTSLIMDFRKTLNAHVRSGLSDSVIDAAIGGENVFALTFFLSLPQDSIATGGYLVCDEQLSYCRPNTPLGYYGGVSESSSEFRNHPWSELLNSDGFPRMELIELTGGQSVVASIQPRVGRDTFRPGDIYRAVLTNSAGAEVSSRTFTLTPYFVSVPALKSYDAGFGNVDVDYSAVSPESGSIPGTSEGDPLVLSDDGSLQVTFWRPQREAIRSDESGYYDWGNLNYGIVIDDAQATCAGFYSNISSELVEYSTPFGTNDSPLANQGANLVPLKDSSGDRAAVSSNTLSFTVDLKSCLSRAGRSPGIYRITLSARGEPVTGREITAAQTIALQIP
ncbi:MAG: hypothetical protein KDD42_01455, partial [Bdellovibrionales bacterium]|nr:hypothetical protein [Bdellovibrionales bacterium]